MSRSESNIDPFNAGEPELPWDDPASREDVVEDDEGPIAEPAGTYEAPEKADDSYEAPKEDGGDSDRPARGSDRRSRNRARSRERSHGDAAAPAAPVGVPASPVQENVGDGGAGRDTERGSGKPEAGRKKGGGCGCMALFILLAIVAPLVLGLVGSCAASVFNAADGSSSSTGVAVDGGDQEETVKVLVKRSLDGLSSDAHARQVVATWFDDRVRDTLGYDAAGLGLDTGAIADKLLASVDYQLKEAYVTGDSAASSREASVYYDVTALDGYKAWSDFDDEGWDYLRNLGIYASSGAKDLPALTDDQKAHLRSIMDQALDRQANQKTSYFTKLSYGSSDGWKLDQKDFDQNTLNYFGLY